MGPPSRWLGGPRDSASRSGLMAPANVTLRRSPEVAGDPMLEEVRRDATSRPTKGVHDHEEHPRRLRRRRAGQRALETAIELTTAFDASLSVVSVVPFTRAGRRSTHGTTAPCTTSSWRRLATSSRAAGVVAEVIEPAGDPARRSSASPRRATSTRSSSALVASTPSSGSFRAASRSMSRPTRAPR